MNSAADLKAFCGRNGGIVCTSSNAEQVLHWAFERGRRVLFFPDEHLGRNTALKMGIPDERSSSGTNARTSAASTTNSPWQARVILWKGWCSTHQRFTVEQIAQARRHFPGVRVIVHPECRHEIVDAADLTAPRSTSSRPSRSRPPARLGGRHRGQPRQAAWQRAPREDHLLPGSDRLPVLDDVPHSPGLSCLGA